jgi:hypothetical protein
MSIDFALRTQSVAEIVSSKVRMINEEFIRIYMEGSGGGLIEKIKYIIVYQYSYILERNVSRRTLGLIKNCVL